MPRSITNEIVDISVDGEVVKGILNGNETSWNFQSLSMSFLSLFTNGIVHSHTYLGISTMQNQQERFKMAVSERVKELVDERRAAASAQRRMAGYQSPYGAQQHRRIVVPYRH